MWDKYFKNYRNGAVNILLQESHYNILVYHEKFLAVCNFIILSFLATYLRFLWFTCCPQFRRTCESTGTCHVSMFINNSWETAKYEINILLSRIFRAGAGLQLELQFLCNQINQRANFHENYQKSLKTEKFISRLFLLNLIKYLKKWMYLFSNTDIIA
jgi:hypothetical protein